jgi:Heavy-metal resistance
MEDSMRVKTTVSLIFLASVSLFAGRTAAQTESQVPPAQPSEDQQAATGRGSRGAWPVPPGALPPDLAAMMGPVWRSQGVGASSERPGGPLRVFSRLLDALDNPRVRTALGLTDEQAASLRKIIVNTEVSTIQTGATVAVDAINLRELLRADSPNRAAVMAKGDDISKSVSQLINRYLEAILSAKTILTPKQQEMIRAYFENRPARMGMARPRP